MWKKYVVLALAVVLLVASHLNVCCTASVNGQEVFGRYSKEQIRSSRSVAALAAEEILPGRGLEPEVELKYSLSLRPADGDGRILSDRLLRSYTGVRDGDGVFVNGMCIGTVEDGSKLLRLTREFITNQMPNAAVSGNISGELKVRPVYCRSNNHTNYEDMVLLISGLAPVIYVDESGKIV